MARKNPFAGRTGFKSPVLASELRLNGGERSIGRNGELNANDKKDLLRQIAKYLESSSTNGPAVSEETAATREQASRSRREALVAAFNDKAAHRELGEVTAEEIYVTANREGFMRRFLARQPLEQGQLPMFIVRQKNVVGVISGSPTQTQRQLMRDNRVFPPEFYITARPFVEQRDIAQSPTDILEEKFIESLEATMVAEDRVLYRMVQQSIGTDNPGTTIVGTLNPMALGTLKTQVTRWGLPATSMLMANDLWNDITADAGFQQIIDPVSKYELLNTGQLGTVVGMTLFSDAYRHPQHKVLNPGDMMIFTAPENLGQYTDRGGVTSDPIDSATEGIPGRGWMLQELVSIMLGNNRGVAFGTRK